MTPLPSSGKLQDELIDLELGADVDASGRLVKQEDVRSVRSQRPMMTFCWLPPDSERMCVFWLGVLTRME